MQAFFRKGACFFGIACALFLQSSLFFRIDYRSVEIRYFLFYIECFAVCICETLSCFIVSTFTQISYLGIQPGFYSNRCAIRADSEKHKIGFYVSGFSGQ